MSTQTNVELSRVIYDAMDYIGYSKESVSSRAKFFGQYLLTKFRQDDMDRICAGSKAEGTARLLESDLDVMTVLRDYLCVDYGKMEKGLKVVQTDMTGCPPGYTKLIPLEMNSVSIGPPFVDSTCNIVHDIQKGPLFLSTTSFKNYIRYCLEDFLIDFLPEGETFLQNGSSHLEFMQNSGPSIPTKITLSVGDTSFISSDADNVIAMPYHSSTILKTWKNRCRKYKWPSREIIQEISTMEGFVVPVGYKFSEDQDFEWRISYITAEQKLISCLSSVHLKVYVLMKMIFKQIVSKECNIITSYMVKNVIFWLCERYGDDVLTTEKLIDFLQHGLMFILNCLNSNFLPNYMIPKRNLLLGQEDTLKRNKLRQVLRDLLHEKGVFVFKLQQLGAAMNTILRNPVLGKLNIKLQKAVENHSLIIGQRFWEKLTQVAHLSQRNLTYDFIMENLTDPLVLESTNNLLEIMESVEAEKRAYSFQ